MRVVIEPGGCWRWVGGGLNGSGYRQIQMAGRRWLAHRVVYTVFVGRVPAGYDLHHTCGVRTCMNPAHLEPLPRRAHAQRHLSPTCRRGHSMADAIVTNDRRRCRICADAYQRAYRAQRKAR